MSKKISQRGKERLSDTWNRERKKDRNKERKKQTKRKKERKKREDKGEKMKLNTTKINKFAIL